jgi:hypothetical protein
MKFKLAKFKKVMGRSKKCVSMKAKLEKFNRVMRQKTVNDSMKARLAKFHRVMSKRPGQKRKGETSANNGPASKVRRVGPSQASGSSIDKVCNISETVL